MTSSLIQLQQLLFDCTSTEALRYTLVNHTRIAIPYQQATLLKRDSIRGKLQINTLSNLPTVDRTTPFAQWHETVANQIAPGMEEQAPLPVTLQMVPEEIRAQWVEVAPQFLLYVPIDDHYTLLLGNDTPWPADALPLLQHIARSFAQGIALLSSQQRWNWRGVYNRRWALLITLLLVAIQFLPVSLSAIAPCEITPHRPFVVTAPFQAVVNKIEIQPNQPVTQGETLLSLEVSDLTHELTVAERELAVSQARLLKMQQTSFVDARAKSSLAELEAEVALHQERVNHARYRLGQANLTSPIDGIAIIDEVESWRGRPVDTGEAILKVANPKQTEIEILLPVSDAINLQPGGVVDIFLDIDPLHPLAAEIQHASYEPLTTPNGTVAYHVVARLLAPSTSPRIGLQGSAKVYGEEVSLFYYLFRRPITALRQWLGW